MNLTLLYVYVYYMLTTCCVINWTSSHQDEGSHQQNLSDLGESIESSIESIKP